MEEGKVVLTLDEYDEMISSKHDLLKDTEKVDGIYELIEEYAKVEECSSFGVKGIEFSNVYEFTKELLQLLYYVDKRRYKRMVITVKQRPTKSEGE